MRRLLPTTLGGRLYFAGTALLVAVVVVAVLTTRGGGPPTVAPPPATTTAPATAPATTAAAPTTVPTTTAPPTTAPTTTAPPAPVAMSWERAGGLVWHASEIDPTVLGQEMRGAGFGWVALFLADGLQQDVPPPSWIERFRAASGLPVGGWTVLRTDPVGEAQLAASLVDQDGLDFYVADAEEEYGYTDGSTQSSARYRRSQEFVRAFRAAEPALPAGLSSYCRPDEHDLDWSAWAKAGFVFLPQAYVSQLGAEGDPAVCVRAAARWFPPAAVHPTLGIFPGPSPLPDPGAYAQLLVPAGTVGFSLFPAENARDVYPDYGSAIEQLHVATPLQP
jgi:hypothetical protein